VQTGSWKQDCDVLLADGGWRRKLHRGVGGRLIAGGEEGAQLLGVVVGVHHGRVMRCSREGTAGRRSCHCVLLGRMWSRCGNWRELTAVGVGQSRRSWGATGA
jgi:hypothetical protein